MSCRRAGRSPHISPSSYRSGVINDDRITDSHSSQIANIGPITYGLLRHYLESPPPQHLAVTVLLSVGCLASLGLVLGWDLTASLADRERSVGLFVAVFCLALVDCTSSVLFLPYMAVFKEIYLNSYLIGEGMSGFVPSIAALSQGVTGSPECVNGTLHFPAERARFSTSSFFGFLMAMMIISLTAFLMLHYLPSLRSERVTGTEGASRSSSANFSNVNSDSDDNASSVIDESDQDNSVEVGGEISPESDTESDTKTSIYPLLLVQCLVCCLSNGALPSIQSYSCAPYGNTIYHLAVTLSAMANPMMAFLAFFLPCTRRSIVFSLTVTGCLLSTYILATALNSPDMILGVTGGGALVVLTWVATGALFSYVKVVVAGMCRNSGFLFSCGVVTQIGSALGALIMFILVNEVVSYFPQYFPHAILGTTLQKHAITGVLSLNIRSFHAAIYKSDIGKNRNKESSVM